MSTLLVSLNRWLDKTKVTPLTRTRGQLIIPAYSLDPANDAAANNNDGLVWGGVYSKRMMQFNYRISHNFSLILNPSLVAVLNATTLCWCIRNTLTRKTDGVHPDVVRYKLNSSGNEVVNAPMYNGSAMKGQYLEIEAWSTLDTVNMIGTPFTSPAISIPTSVLSPDTDRRYGVDYSLSAIFESCGGEDFCFAPIFGAGPDLFPIPMTFLAKSVGGRATP